METICLDVYFYISVAVLIIAGAGALLRVRLRSRHSRVFTPLNILTAGVLLAAIVLFAPMYFVDIGPQQDTAGDPMRTVSSLLLAAHSAIRFFIVENDFQVIKEYATGDIAPYYANLVLWLMIFSALLTFSFVVSFFKNVSAYVSYAANYFRSVYVFSELSEKSLALAQDIRNKHRFAALVFTDSFRVQDDEHRALNAQARNIDAICFKKDIASIKFDLHARGKEIWFFAMAEDEKVNLSQGLQLFQKYGKRPNSHLFVFTCGAESEVLFTAAVDNADFEGGMKVRRINTTRFLVQRMLYDDGYELFENAKKQTDGKKLISAVVVGLGDYGTNMTKALAWFCQMDGYKVQIDAFDRDPMALERFAAQCPELMDDKHNGVSIPGEAEYTIRIHPDSDVDLLSFSQEIQKLRDTTYVLVALGSDDENLRVALQMRMLFERMGIKPVIQAIIYSPERKAALTGRRNFKGQPYDIDYIGDIRSFYTEDVIIDSDLERDALRRHMQYDREATFWAYEYNYRSSVALAVHARMRRLCGIPGANKPQEELTGEERAAIELLEHRRWNAYMRAEGYIFSGSTEKTSRNDLAKIHHDLVPFAALTEEEKRKDSAVGSR